MEPYEPNGTALDDYRQQSREFLNKSREYLSAVIGIKLPKRAGAPPAWMAKAVAEAQGWHYGKHDEFFTVMYQASDLSGNIQLRTLWPVANALHGFFYTRKRFLRPDIISEGLDDVELLLDILEPLTEVVSKA